MTNRIPFVSIGTGEKKSLLKQIQNPPLNGSSQVVSGSCHALSRILIIIMILSI